MHVSQLIKFSSKKKILLILILVFLLLLLSAVFFKIIGNQYKIDCNANYSIVNLLGNKKVIHLRSENNEFDNELRIRLEGVLSYNDVETNVSRTLSFKVNKRDNIMHLKTMRVLKSSADNTDDNVLEGVMPVFYIRENTEGILYVYKQKNGDYVFSTGAVPSIYCARQNR